MGGRVSWAPEETLQGNPNEATPYHTPSHTSRGDSFDEASHPAPSLVHTSAASSSYDAADIHRHLHQQQVSNFRLQT